MYISKMYRMNFVATRYPNKERKMKIHLKKKKEKKMTRYKFEN